jgi:hypothetical protein
MAAGPAPCAENRRFIAGMQKDGSHVEHRASALAARFTEVTNGLDDKPHAVAFQFDAVQIDCRHGAIPPQRSSSI